jgi:hypothetical protein
MAGTGSLEVYLNDHLAAAAAAVELVDTLRANNEGTPLDAHLSRVGAEIEADRETLRRIMDSLAVPQSAVKQAGGRVVERLSRLRLHDRITGDPHVSRLMEIETVSLGIEGKAALWRSLQTIAPDRPALAAFDLPGLVARALAQREGLEPYRLEAAAQAFAP